jgi:hypothetical protein
LISAAVAAAVVLIRVQIVRAENEAAAAITLGGLLEYAKQCGRGLVPFSELRFIPVDMQVTPVKCCNLFNFLPKAFIDPTYL